MKKEIKTRFAPSPTGYMHIGNLRTALYSYLIAKHNNGKFVLRIEDTDQKRYIENSVDVILNTLKQTKLFYDEGPYYQSQRKEIYLKYAKQLIEQGDAYYCFCPEAKTDLERSKDEYNYEFSGYNGHCRYLTKEQIEKNLKNNLPYVIRQKIPKDKDIIYKDKVFGEIKISSNVLDDQILIKSDGLPTYNFANVIDDHLMGITHIVRGSEYISSTPKYILLYKAFHWNIPKYIHLPLILGKDSDGNISKLSKRHGAVSFEDLINQGYLSEAIVNYIMFLGWYPGNPNEIYSLDELIKIFEIKDLNKSDAIFDYQKLDWINFQYIQNLSVQDFIEYGKKFIPIEILNKWNNIAFYICKKITKFSEIPEKIHYFITRPENYNIDLFFQSKYNLTKKLIKKILNELYFKLPNTDQLSLEVFLKELASNLGIKFGAVMWCFRIALTGSKNSITGGYETASILEKDEVLKRIYIAIQKF